MSYRNTYMHFKYYLIASFSTTLLIAPVLAPQIQLAHAGSKSPYDSGYDHGCDDADISDPLDRYISEPGKDQVSILMNLCKDIMLAIMTVPMMIILTMTIPIV